MTWNAVDQAEHITSVVREYPRWELEGAIHYAARIAVLGGLMPREMAGSIDPDEDIKRGAGVPRTALQLVPPRDVRLPYREAGSDDE